MTIDERLDRLTERHEALTHVIELSHRDFEERLGRITQAIEVIAGMQRENEARFRENEERFRKNEERLAQLMETHNRLGRILEIHDRRLDQHEQRLEDLEGDQGQ